MRQEPVSPCLIPVHGTKKNDCHGGNHNQQKPVVYPVKGPTGIEQRAEQSARHGYHQRWDKGWQPPCGKGSWQALPAFSITTSNLHGTNMASTTAFFRDQKKMSMNSSPFNPSQDLACNKHSMCSITSSGMWQAHNKIVDIIWT